VQEAEKDAFIASVVAFLKASKAVSAANPLLMASIGQSCVRPRHLPQLKVLIEERRDLFGVVTEGLTHHVWLTQAHHGQQQQQQPPQRARTSACTAGAYYAAVRDYLRDQGAVTGSRGLLLSKLGTEFPKAERPAALVRFGWIALLEQASAATEGAVNFRLKDCHRPGYAAVWTDRGGEEEEEAAMVVRMVGGGGEAWAAVAAEAHVIYLHFHSPVGQADVQKHATFLQASRFVREEVEVFRLQGILVDCFQHGSARFERHEFLGDALLRVGQTKTLMSRHGDLGPGALTELRINAEQATTLAMVFTDLDLQPWTALSPCSTRKAWCKARCDVVEALIGELDERLRDQHIPLSLVMRERMKYVIQTITDLTIHRGFQLKAKAARDALPWRA
jgi:dsRNA-specific ribonuclease